MRRLIVLTLTITACVAVPPAATTHATSCQPGHTPTWTRHGWRCTPTTTTVAEPTTTTVAPDEPTTTTEVPASTDPPTTTTAPSVTTTAPSPTTSTAPPDGGSSSTVAPDSSSPSDITEPPAETDEPPLPDDCIGTPGSRTTRWTNYPCDTPPPGPYGDACLIDGEPHYDYETGPGGPGEREGTLARFFQPCHLPFRGLPATGIDTADLAVIAAGLTAAGCLTMAVARRRSERP